MDTPDSHYLGFPYLIQILILLSSVQGTTACDFCSEEWWKWTLGFMIVVFLVFVARLLKVLKRRARVRNRAAQPVVKITQPKDNKSSDRPVSLPPMRSPSQSSLRTSLPGSISRSQVTSAPPYTLDYVTEPVNDPAYPPAPFPLAADRGWPTEALPPGYVINLSYNNNNSSTVPVLPPIALPSDQPSHAALPPPPSYSFAIGESQGHI